MFLIFENTREVIRAEKMLKEKGLRVVVKPLPKELSAECGMCLYLDEEIGEGEAILASAEITYRVG